MAGGCLVSKPVKNDPTLNKIGQKLLLSRSYLLLPRCFVILDNGRFSPYNVQKAKHVSGKRQFSSRFVISTISDVLIRTRYKFLCCCNDFF